MLDHLSKSEKNPFCGILIRPRTTTLPLVLVPFPFLSVIPASVTLLTHTNRAEEGLAMILYFSFMQERWGLSTAFGLQKTEGESPNSFTHTDVSIMNRSEGT